MTDKVVIVVGASSGMGRATALAFAREGAQVVAAARHVEALQELEPHVAAIRVCDVQSRAEVNALAQRTHDRFGRIDVVIHTTGTNIPDRALTGLADETWDMMVATNLTGAFNITKAMLPAMRAQGEGLIIYISSAAVQRPDLSGVAYQATKHGLNGLAFGTFQEEKSNGIRTTVIYPGLTDTPLVLRRPLQTPPEVMAQALQPDDVAQACLFVASLPPRCLVPELMLVPSGLW